MSIHISGTDLKAYSISFILICLYEGEKMKIAENIAPEKTGCASMALVNNTVQVYLSREFSV